MLWILSLHNNNFSNPTAQRWHVAGAIADTDEGKINGAVGECWWYHKVTVQMQLVVDAYQPLLDDANRCGKRCRDHLIMTTKQWSGANSTQGKENANES